MKIASLIAASILAANLMSAPAQAADREFSEQIFVAVANTIAAQGNQALRDIRTELRQGLLDALKPILPVPDEAQNAGDTDQASPARAVQ